MSELSLAGKASESKNRQTEVLDYLLYAMDGAESMGDEEGELRIARAVTAFNAPIDMAIFRDGVADKTLDLLLNS